VRRTADEIVHLRKFPRRDRWWWELDGRSCPGCGKLWRRAHTVALNARPEWVTCLGCGQKKLRGEWTREAEAEFIAKARAVFPGSHEPVRSVSREPESEVQLAFNVIDMDAERRRRRRSGGEAA
jgi:hypothetical protein